MKDWILIVEKLILIAQSQPQLAYSALTKSIQSKWTYLKRVTPECRPLFEPLEVLIAERLLPTIFGSEITPHERTLFSLPTCMGRLNVLNPTTDAVHNYNESREMTRPLIAALKGTTPLDAYEFHLHYSSVQQTVHKDREDVLEGIFNDTITQFGDMQQRAVLRAKNERLSSWLNVSPISKNHFDLTAQEFRDALAIRYKKPLLRVPSHCDGCGALFDLSHALSCRKGGLVTQRHNEVRNAFGDLASIAWSQVVREPVVREANSLLILLHWLLINLFVVFQHLKSRRCLILGSLTLTPVIIVPAHRLPSFQMLRQKKRRNTNNHVVIGEHFLLQCVYW